MATEVFFAGAAFFTPTGLEALVAVAFFGPLFAPVLAVARFVVVVSATVGKILGFEFPKYAVQRNSRWLRAELYQASGKNNRGFRWELTGRLTSSFARHCFLQRYQHECLWLWFALNWRIWRTRLERATMRPGTWNILTVWGEIDLKVFEFDRSVVA